MVGKQVIGNNTDFWILFCVRCEATGVLSREVAGFHSF